MERSKAERPVEKTYKPNFRSPAAKYNRTVMDGLAKKLRDQPETDIAVVLMPDTYSKTLMSFKAIDLAKRRATTHFPTHDVRSRLSTDDEAVYLHGPTPLLQGVLPPGEDLSQAIVDGVETAGLIYEGAAAASRAVFRVGEQIVCKFAGREEAADEYHALRFLEENFPEFPAPRAHGVVAFGQYGLLFSDYKRGLALSTTWPEMTDEQKQSVSRQLDALFTALRALPRPAGTPLGALQDGGCRDDRRHDLSRGKGIMTAAAFDEWVIQGAKLASSEYRTFYRDLLATQPEARVVFTHGDIRLPNVIVNWDGADWKIQSVVDWENAGFYPDYWESIKATFGQGAMGKVDWYNFLPPSIAPAQNAGRWALDSLWGRCM